MDYIRLIRYRSHIIENIIPLIKTFINTETLLKRLKSLEITILYSAPESIPFFTEKLIEFCNLYLMNLAEQNSLKLQKLLDEY